MEDTTNQRLKVLRIKRKKLTQRLLDYNRVEDNSGQTVTNKVDGLPDGVTFDEATNTISGTPSEVGSYDITVTTTDENEFCKQQHSQ